MWHLKGFKGRRLQQMVFGSGGRNKEALQDHDRNLRQVTADEMPVQTVGSHLHGPHRISSLVNLFNIIPIQLKASFCKIRSVRQTHYGLTVVDFITLRTISSLSSSKLHLDIPSRVKSSAKTPKSTLKKGVDSGYDPNMSPLEFRSSPS